VGEGSLLVALESFLPLAMAVVVEGCGRRAGCCGFGCGVVPDVAGQFGVLRSVMGRKNAGGSLTAKWVRVICACLKS
jgi:hypothetical protein